MEIEKYKAELEAAIYEGPDGRFYIGGKVIEKVLLEVKNQFLNINDAVGFICPCCGSNKTYKTDAIHCNRCAVTTEI
jgi:hypothetical protein